MQSNTTFVYHEPLLIEDATPHANVLSTYANTSLGYIRGVYEIPQYSIDKCTVVKAAVCFEDGTLSPVQTRSYFVGLKGRESVDGIGIVSLSLNPEAFFDYETGIYVLGKTYETEQEASPYWWWANGNFRNKGKKWEREAFVQFFDKDGALQLSQTIGVRIKGGGTRGFAQKSLNMYARKEYDGNKRFCYDFFGTGYEAKKLTLFSGGDDICSKSADFLVSEACASGAFSTFHFVPYALFLNGEYWGMYYLTEKYDDHFLEETYNINADDAVMIKNGAVEEGNDEDILLWNETWAFINADDMSLEEKYNKALQYIDIESFAQYYAAQIYIARWNDWPGGNWAAWRTRENTGTGYNDGRWRWMLFDVNSGALDDATKEIDPAVDAAFSSLYRNEGFRRIFVQALSRAAREWFPQKKMDALIDNFGTSYTACLEESYKRWFGSKNESGIAKTLAARKAFFQNRADFVATYIEENR